MTCRISGRTRPTSGKPPGDCVVAPDPRQAEGHAQTRSLARRQAAGSRLLAKHVGVVEVTAVLLPIPDDPRFQAMIEAWPRYLAAPAYPSNFPRSRWLGEFEALLREFLPSANSRSLSLTARHAAPFYLAEGHDVP